MKYLILTFGLLAGCSTHHYYGPMPSPVHIPGQGDPGRPNAGYDELPDGAPEGVYCAEWGDCKMFRRR